MDYCELEASAETELREAILLEFLKPELPAPITLLRHCERYTVRIFDAQAERLFDRGPRPDDYWRCLRNMVEKSLAYFFSFPGGPWSRCIEYAMLGRVDHGPEPRPSEDEILGTYLHINGHLFLSYALQTRVDFWHSRAQSAYLARTGAAEARKRGPKPDWEDIEISFIGDHDAEMRIAETQARKVNYKEIAGFEDRRTGKPSQLWAMLRVFGSLPDGTMPDDARTGKEWEAIRKKIERTSKALRKHFGMTGDPFPYIRGTGYRARIKIRPAPDSSR